MGGMERSRESEFPALETNARPVFTLEWGSPWFRCFLSGSRLVMNFLLWLILLLTYFFQFTYVEGNSMANTLKQGDRLFVDKLTTRMDHLTRGDIVVFSSVRNPRVNFVKRLIAFEGEMVEIRHGVVWVDGHPLREDYLDHLPLSSFPRYRVPKGFVFVLGDNRERSQDSRSWGAVPRGYLHGVARFRFWPLSRLGPLGAN